MSPLDDGGRAILLRGAGPPAVRSGEACCRRSIVGDHDQVFRRSIRGGFRIVQLPQAFLIGAPRMEARSFEKVADFGSHIVINKKLEPRPWGGLSCATPISCFRGQSPKTRSSYAVRRAARALSSKATAAAMSFLVRPG